jgi:hypothetical protein
MKHLAFGFIVSMTSLALMACGGGSLEESVKESFADKGVTSVECRERASDTEHICLLKLGDGTDRVILVHGTASDWTSEACLSSKGCEGW